MVTVMEKLRFWLAGLLGGCFVLFALQNMASVEVQFLLWSFTAQRFLIITLSFLIGGLFGWLVRAHGWPFQKTSGTAGKSE